MPTYESTLMLYEDLPCLRCFRFTLTALGSYSMIIDNGTILRPAIPRIRNVHLQFKFVFKSPLK